MDSRSFLVISHCPEGALNSQNFADIIKDMGLNMDYLLTVSIRDVWTRKQKDEAEGEIREIQSIRRTYPTMLASFENEGDLRQRTQKTSRSLSQGLIWI